jgi:Excalibur calcium-binding domain
MTWQPRRKAPPRKWRLGRWRRRFRFPFWAGWMTVAVAAGVLYLTNGPDPLAGYGAEGYQCGYNAYNCSDFRTRAEAQRVYQACGGLRNDVHHLDRDRDGQACEWLR